MKIKFVVNSIVYLVISYETTILYACIRIIFTSPEIIIFNTAHTQTEYRFPAYIISSLPPFYYIFFILYRHNYQNNNNLFLPESMLNSHFKSVKIHKDNKRESDYFVFRKFHFNQVSVTFSLKRSVL